MMTSLLLALVIGSPILPTADGAPAATPDTTPSLGIMGIPNPGPVPITFDFGFPVSTDREKSVEYWLSLFR